MRVYLLFLLCLTVFPITASAQDVETQYLKLQESYTQRLLDIQARFQKSQRELLNKFILALVRVEQEYREDANLDGVVYCRTLQEQLLTQPGFPTPGEEAPEAVVLMLDTLARKRTENRDAHQQELHQLNVLLYNTLERYQQEFTRQAMAKQADEIKTLRQVLSRTLSRAREAAQATATISTTLSANPNVLPFAIEGEGYSGVRGVIPRSCLLDLTITEEGLVKKEPLGYRFINGRLRIPANQTGPLMQDLARNRMLSVECAFQPFFDPQGNANRRVVVFQIGEDTDSALFSLTLEGQSICLYFMTNVPPADRANHRFVIGQFKSPNPVHIAVTYRQGELIAYLNGTATLSLRNQVTGTLDEWKPAPVIMGKEEQRPGFIYPFRGILHHVYLKSGEESSRQVVANYNRFLLLFK